MSGGDMIYYIVVFCLGAAGMCLVWGFTSRQSWHDKHHQNRTELMCDACMKRYHEGGAPPLRVLGDKRR